MHLLTLFLLSETQTATVGKVSHCSHINRSQAGSQALCLSPALRLCSLQIDCTKRSEDDEGLFIQHHGFLQHPRHLTTKGKSEKTTEQTCWPSTTDRCNDKLSFCKQENWRRDKNPCLVGGSHLTGGHCQMGCGGSGVYVSVCVFGEGGGFRQT